jgi:hypothetical protein
MVIATVVHFDKAIRFFITTSLACPGITVHVRIYFLSWSSFSLTGLSQEHMKLFILDV